MLVRALSAACDRADGRPTARAADLLFVKVVPNHTNDLFVHCQREAIPFVSFEQFLQVRDAVAAVVSGTKTVQETLDGQK